MNARFISPADEAEPTAHTPRHEPFSWLHHSLKDNAHAEFMALTFDVCKGAELALSIAQESDLERDHAPLGGYITASQSEYLRAMVSRSLRMLADRAEAAISDLNDAALRSQAGSAA